MPRLLSLVLAPVLLAVGPAAAQDGPAPGAASTLGAQLGADDECRRGSEGCGLNAMQLRRRSMAMSEVAGELETAEPATAAQPETSKEAAAPAGVAEYQQCGGLGYTGATECAEGLECFNKNEYFAMCKKMKKRSWKKYNSSDSLDAPSDAKNFMFYMYRAMDPSMIAPLNSNAASIGAIMWYIHDDVASCTNCPQVRSYGIDRIVRYRVQTKATQPLKDASMNFGLTLSFEDGRCMGMGDCDEIYGKYGYYVGCNNLSAGFPYPSFPVPYTGVLYSLPGGCTAHVQNEKSWECKQEQPGGLCEGTPTGAGNCTWSYEDAGVVTLDELEGIANFTAFKEMGGEEYNKTADAGIQMTFWDNMKSPKANAERVKKLDDMFKEKYPDMPSDAELPKPPCDFAQRDFLASISGFSGPGDV